MLVPNSPIPTPARPILRTRLAWLLLLAAIPVFAAKPEAPLRIPLENFGKKPVMVPGGRQVSSRSALAGVNSR